MAKISQKPVRPGQAQGTPAPAPVQFDPLGQFSSNNNPFAQVSANIREKQKTKEQEAAKREAKISSGYAAYGDPNTKPSFSVTGTPEERQRALEGLELARVGYGQNLFETGEDISRIREQLRQRSSGLDPVSAAIMGEKASAVSSASRELARQGAKGGAAMKAVSDVERAKSADIAASLYGQQRQSIADERSLASNTLAGTVAQMQGSKAEGVQMPDAPRASGMMDTVLCTELHRQGIMPKELYLKDSRYGYELNSTHPEVVVGYHVWAKPLVRLMQVSPLATSILKVPVMKWAKHIAEEEKSLFGYFCVKIGQPICGIIGKIKLVGDLRCTQK
jgi:hypothetical protein